MTPQFANIDWAGRPVRVEYEWLGPRSGPLIVFLHEGLGSVARWRDFPARLCDATGARGLVYSRPGYGRSTPRAAGEAWGTDFLHRQAHEVLPALFRALGVHADEHPPYLFGHSDGGSIALLFAASYQNALRGAIVLAPHIMVEDRSIESIVGKRQAYVEADLRPRLAKYHDDPDSAFWGWNDIWLNPQFRRWSIEDEIPAITCPLLAVQGVDDEFGTLEQIRGIARRAPQTQVLELDNCRHAIPRDQPDALIEATGRFIRNHTAGDKS